jgi:hypothetical protein
LHAFKDNAGRTWEIVINVAQVKRVRGLLGLDLLGLVDDGFAGLGKLLGNPVDLVDCIYVLCKADADAAGVTDEDFGRAMAGDAIGAAADAFYEEFRDFFADPRMRGAMGELKAAAERLKGKLLDRVEMELRQAEATFEASTSTDPSGSSPASSDSTPDPSHSSSSA